MCRYPLPPTSTQSPHSMHHQSSVFAPIFAGFPRAHLILPVSASHPPAATSPAPSATAGWGPHYVREDELFEYKIKYLYSRGDPAPHRHHRRRRFKAKERIAPSLRFSLLQSATTQMTTVTGSSRHRLKGLGWLSALLVPGREGMKLVQQPKHRRHRGRVASGLEVKSASACSAPKSASVCSTPVLDSVSVSVQLCSEPSTELLSCFPLGCKLFICKIRDLIPGPPKWIPSKPWLLLNILQRGIKMFGSHCYPI